MDNIHKQKQNIYGIKIFNYDNNLNYNDDNVIKHKITNKYIDEQDSYINIISKIIYNKISDVKKIFNNKINFNLLYKRDKYINGFETLQIFNIYNFDFNESFLYVDISLPSLIMIYSMLYNEKSINKNFDYYILYNSDYLDELLIKYHNAPNSSSPILNKILYLRSFPIFNYIMEKISNKYLNDNNRHLLPLTYQEDINNPDFTKDITFLNYLYFDNIDYYTYNIKNLMNNNINILSYLFNIESSIDFRNFNDILSNEYNIDNIYQDTNNFNENILNLYILKNELLNITNIIDDDMYFENNKLYNLNKIVIDKDIKYSQNTLLQELKNYNDNKLLNAIYLKGLYRFYHEMLTICTNFFINGIILSNNKNGFNYNYIDNEAIEYTINNISLIKSINNNKINFINNSFNHSINSNNISKIFFTNLFSSKIFKFSDENITLFLCAHFEFINTESMDGNVKLTFNYKPKILISYERDYQIEQIMYIYQILNNSDEYSNISFSLKSNVKRVILEYIFNNFNNNINRYNKLFNIITNCIQNKYFLFPLLLLYVKNDIAIDTLILFYENQNTLDLLTDIYDKFINTINFVSFLNNNINKSLTTFLLFSNDKVRVRYNINDSFTKLLSSLYNPKYDVVLSLNSL